jgi:hypothetical protein
MSNSFHWTRRRMDLLTKLVCVLSGTLCEWNTFISSNGDIGYFSDLDELPSGAPKWDYTSRWLRNIKQAFEKLENDRQRLITLKESLSSDF